MKRYILYVKNSCCFCHKAVELLNNLNLECDLISIGSTDTLFDSLKKAYDWSTVPMIFSTEEDKLYKFIGGFDDLKKVLEEKNVG